LSDPQKCSRIADYCSKSTKEVIELLPGYLERNWAKLQVELKNMYWPHDSQCDTPAVLNQLVKDAPGMDLNVFMLKYTAITVVLVGKGAMSALDRVGHLLDGLSPDLREKGLRLCAKRNWRLSAHDTGTMGPVFDELREFVLMEAKAMQKETVYAGERALREGTPMPLMESVTITNDVSGPPPPPTTKVEAAAVGKPVSSPATDAITELTQQFSKLALLIEANLQRGTSPTRNEPKLSNSQLMPSTVPRRFDNSRSGPPPCHWCDNAEHRRWQCSEFTDAMAKGFVRLNENNRVVNCVTGQELPLIYGRGGMKVLFTADAVQPKPATTTVTSSVITVNEIPSATLDPENSVHLVTIRDDASELHEIIDADVNIKRQRNDLTEDRNRRVRP